MLDLRIIYDVEGWAFSNAARALRQQAPADFRVSVSPLMNTEGVLDPAAALGNREPDVVFVMHTRPEKPALVHDLLRARGWRPAIVGAWNSGWPLNTEALPARYAQVDALLMNNTIAWQQVQHMPRIHLCPNGVDLDLFRVIQPIATRPPRVLWCGSQYWRQVKGYDDFVLPLAQRLAARGIGCDFRLVDSHGPNRLTPPAMAEWYNTGAILLCASLTEGTPNTALEAAACGCTVVSTAVGNMPELIEPGRNGYLVDRSVDALEDGMLRALTHSEDLSGRLQHDIRRWGWEHRAPAFYAAFRQALAERSRLTQLDLRVPALGS